MEHQSDPVRIFLVKSNTNVNLVNVARINIEVTLISIFEENCLRV
jgi:hypothetical protein